MPDDTSCIIKPVVHRIFGRLYLVGCNRVHNLGADGVEVREEKVRT